MENYEISNKLVTVYYEDLSSNRVGRKDALCVKLTGTAIFLENNMGIIEIIPLRRIVRIIQKGGD